MTEDVLDRGEHAAAPELAPAPSRRLPRRLRALVLVVGIVAAALIAALTFRAFGLRSRAVAREGRVPPVGAPAPPANPIGSGPSSPGPGDSSGDGVWAGRPPPGGEVPDGVWTPGVGVGTETPRYARTYSKSRGLLIGIGAHYATIGFEALPNAERDVELIAARLDGLEGESWDVAQLTAAQATRDAIVGRLRDLADAGEPDDKLFVYFAGHGARHEVSGRSGWIVPADARTAEEDPQRISWLRLDEFRHLFDESRAKHVFVAMDCCYGGRLTTTDVAFAGDGGDRRTAAYARAFLGRAARVVLTSGLPDQRVSDGPQGEHSPFARAFADALAPADGAPVTAFDIFTHVRRAFLEEGIAHLPIVGTPEGSTPGGDVVFFPKR